MKHRISGPEWSLPGWSALSQDRQSSWSAPTVQFDEVIFGDAGDNFFVGGFASQKLVGEGGDDVFVHVPALNGAGGDKYMGGAGDDVLILSMTAEDWLGAAFQADLAGLVTPAESFTFSAFDLTITSMEQVVIYVDGVMMTLADDPVVLEGDTIALVPGATSASVNVLANDTVPDLVASLRLRERPEHGTVTIADDGTATYVLDPGVTLGPGETLTDSFTYRVRDADGDARTARVDVVIEGPEPLPGFILEFPGAGDSFGIAVSTAGDINNDGVDDFLVGAPTMGANGQVYVIYGGTAPGDAGFDPAIDLDDLDPSQGFILMGDTARGNPGYSISTAGDVNGDGIDDMIIGASAHRQPSLDDAGVAYVVFGVDGTNGEAFDPVVELSDIDGTNGFVIEGSSDDDKFGWKVNEAGDVNGDGIGDVIVGAYGVDDAGDQAGAAYVVFGRADGTFDPLVSVDDLDGSNGFAIPGTAAENRTGHSVSGLGDVNGDGIDDIIVGAYGTEVRGDTYSGEVHVIYGRAGEDAWEAEIDLDALDGTNGFTLRGTDAGDSVGRNVSNVGDVNGDGINDMIMAGFGYDPTTDKDGTVYVVYGRDTAVEGDFAATINLAALNGTTGFVIESVDPEDLLGRSMSALGDQDGDGIGEFLLGAPDADPDGLFGTGEVYLVFGSEDFGASFDLETLDGTNGYRIIGVEFEEHAGYAVANAGDIDGDGIEDIVIGSYGEEFASDPITYDSYVLYGGVENLGTLDAADGAVDGVIDLAVLSSDDYLMG